MKPSSAAAGTVYSRRRTRAPRSRVPDWVWGAGLGVLVILFVGAFFATRELTGGDDGDPCGGDLAPLGTSEISAEAFAEEDAALKVVTDLLIAGDRAGAETAFFGPVHNFTHNVHPVLRDEDPDAAQELCEAVITLENRFASNSSNSSTAVQVDRVRGLLRDAAVALGYPRPG